MSWQAATFLFLLAVLVAGFAWYERSRPPARLVAMIAALTALAVAGRVALAPLPNVVATTDIVLISGFALGPAPGFVIGALAAPISNVWLGQGPWTVWQMAGWGAIGLMGAGLAALARDRVGRWSLASACALAGLAFGGLQDLSIMVTYGGEQSVERFLALSSRAVPFNLAHATASFLIALAVAPALVRMLRRHHRRSRFDWRPSPPPSHTSGAGARAAVLLLALAVLVAGGLGSAERAEAQEPKRYLVRAQGPDGGFGASPGSPSNPAMTSWAMMGLAAAGLNPRDLVRGGRSPVDYLRQSAPRIRSIGDLERTIIALSTSGVDATSFAGRNLPAELEGRRRRDGSWGGQTNLTAFGVIALRAAGRGSASLAPSLEWLTRTRHESGGWGFRPGAFPDADSTGAVLQALGAAGRRSGRAVAQGISYLRRAQSSDGGWSLAGGTTNSQSTAWALQGLIAQGASPASVTSGGRSGIDFLRSRIAPDGHFTYSASSDQSPVWVTGQALVAYSGKAWPHAAPPRGRTVTGGPSSGRRAQRDAGGGSRGRAGGAALDGLPGASRGGRGTSNGSGRGDRERERAKRAARDGEGEGGGAARPVEDPPRSMPRAERAGADVGERSGSTTTYALAGLGALAAALTGGFFVYRRRLP